MDFSILSGIFARPWDMLRSLIDIAIVAYLLYRILRLISGTRAEQLLKGLMLLLVLSVAASYLELAMMTWIVEKLWIVFAITLPIVFQPELRRILEQIGRGSFFSAQRLQADPATYRSIVQEITRAAGILSRNRVGALMVLVRDTGIGEYLESGNPVDALVTCNLLVNIFVPNSPLHDGAVVVTGGRLEKAACFLPLSDNANLDLKLGTRHRAGIGITEVSDALAVIVSEETGSISLASEGTLTTFKDEFELKAVLDSQFAEPTHWGHNLRRRWFTDVDSQ